MYTCTCVYTTTYMWSTIKLSIQKTFVFILVTKKLSPLLQGEILESTLNWRCACQSVLRSMYMHMKSIGRMRHHLDDSACKKVVSALVLSRLDYANSSLLGITDTLIKRLQVLQNNAARLVSGVKRWESVTPALTSLVACEATDLFQNPCYYTRNSAQRFLSTIPERPHPPVLPAS